MSIASSLSRKVLLLTASIVLFAVPSFAQDAAGVVERIPTAVMSPDSMTSSPDSRSASSKRPAALVPLQVSFALLQAFDVHSTMRALANGGVEANPVVASFVDKPAALFVLKGATTASVLYFTSRIAKHNRTAAIVTMIGLNCGYGLVAWHNYAIGRRNCAGC
jgi:hypothetical protein